MGRRSVISPDGLSVPQLRDIYPREFCSWSSMLARCNTKSNLNYHRYGGRGIGICARWHRFHLFLEDMGEKPMGLSLDRINNDGDYEPGNCRWATDHQQNNNKRTTVRIAFNGITKSRSEWARELNIRPDRVIKVLGVAKHGGIWS